MTGQALRAFASTLLAAPFVQQPPGAASAPAELLLFVSPRGDDAWSGRLAEPDAGAHDGPFATPQRAVAEVAAWRRSLGDAAGDATVRLRKGTLRLDSPLVVGPEATAAKARLTFEAFPGEHPVLSGGTHLARWQVGERSGRAVWSADLDEAALGIRELWVDGRRATLARHPDRGTLAVEAVPDADGDWTHGNFAFRFRAGDLDASAVGADLVVMSRWVESHMPVVALDAATNTVRTSKRSVFRLDPGDLYYAEGALNYLDAPGEFAVDRLARKLLYVPRPGEDPQRVEAFVPRLQQLLRLDGAPEQERFVDNVTFRGLSFEHAEWWFPADFKSNWPSPDAGGFSQAAILVPAAVQATGARACLFEDCAFTHLGGYALELGRGCVGNTLARCRITDLGAGGVKIGEAALAKDERELARGNAVEDCEIGDGGRIFHSAVGVWIGQSPGNRLVHDEIHDFLYSGLSVGWTWGYGPSGARDERVEGNHVHHIGVRSDGEGPWLSDMAGVYTLGAQPGTVIAGNYFHDVAAARYGGWGIYFDEGTSAVLAEHNVVARTTHGGFHQHYGKDNVFRNNVLVDGRDAQLQRTRPEEHRSFTFAQNIVVWSGGNLFAGDLRDLHFAFERNLYWRSDGAEIRFGDGSFADWQARGMDRGSLVADPRFLDAARGDYRLAEGSPALALGIDVLDVRAVGPRAAPSPSRR